MFELINILESLSYESEENKDLLKVQITISNNIVSLLYLRCKFDKRNDRENNEISQNQLFLPEHFLGRLLFRYPFDYEMADGIKAGGIIGTPAGLQ